MKTVQNAVPDYQRQFSARSIRNYIVSALGPFCTNGFSAMLFSTYLTFVYTEYLGVTAAVISSVISVGVVIDAITDFLMGAVTDKVISRWGKAKHWFFICAVPMAIFMVLMFMAPESGTQTFKVAWVFVVYNLFCICNTAVRIPAQSLPSLVSDDQKVRSNMAWAWNVTSSLSVSALGWIVAPMLQLFGENLYAYRMISAVCAVLSAVTMLISGILLTEQRGKEEWKQVRAEYRAQSSKDGKDETVLQQFRNLLRNKYWLYCVFMNFFGSLGITFVFGVLAYWLQFVAGDQSWLSMIMTVLNIPTLIGCILYVLISKIPGLSTKRIGAWGNILQTLFSIAMWIVGANNIVLMLVLLGVKSFIGGVTSPVIMSVIPDIVDYGEWKTGSRQEGLCNSGIMLTSKISSALGTALTGIILTATGYTGGGVASQLAIDGINFLFLGVPTITIAIGTLLWIFFPLTAEKANRYRAEIQARKESLK